MEPNLNIDKNIFKKHKVKLAYLFGSQAKGRPAPESDYDIAILFAKETDDIYFLNETAYLIDDIRPYFPNEVDIVPLNAADSLLKYEVIYYGKLLYADDERGRIDFEVSSLKEYIDDKHVRDIYFSALEKKIEEGAS